MTAMAAMAELGVGFAESGELARPQRGDATPYLSGHRRLALTFGPDFIHWRRSVESWPSVWPGRRFFCLLNSPAAVAAQVRGRIAALLRRHWQAVFGRPAPPHLARHLLFPMHFCFGVDTRPETKLAR